MPQALIIKPTVIKKDLLLIKDDYPPLLLQPIIYCMLKGNPFKLSAAIVLCAIGTTVFGQSYTMPSENLPHEGTWLQWPHQHEYGLAYRSSLDTTWVAMTKALVQSENVHIIAYDNTEQSRITTLLSSLGISLTHVDFKIFKTNDVWVRDNGPVFVHDSTGELFIEDWGFNGWGGKYNSVLDDAIPTEVANSISVPVINLNSTMTIEGGACMLDGRGVMLATKSSILSQTPANSVRNPGMTQAQAEAILAPRLGISKFIWLNGMTGGGDITDMHIDGFVQFANDSTIVTISNSDLNYWQVPAGDITTLLNATDINNRPYNFVLVPLTQNNVVTTSGTDLGYLGSYCNYYIANSVVLVPFYNDPNDTVALNIIQNLHPGKTAVGIDVRNLYSNGGMVHCVTQQQPVAIATGLNKLVNNDGSITAQLYPNPCSDITTISLSVDIDAEVQIDIYNMLGQPVGKVSKNSLASGRHHISIETSGLANGVYNCVVRLNDESAITMRMVVAK